MELTAVVVIELDGLEALSKALQDGSGEIRKAYDKWVLRYRSFIQQRWNLFSRGGGDWPPLKYRDGSILRDTNTMFMAMAPTLSAPGGSINRPLSNGVEIGFAGSDSHPDGPTIAQLAFWHHTGAGKLPIRKILVEPDDATKAGMRKDLEQVVAA